MSTTTDLATSRSLPRPAFQTAFSKAETAAPLVSLHRGVELGGGLAQRLAEQDHRLRLPKRFIRLLVGKLKKQRRFSEEATFRSHRGFRCKDNPALNSSPLGGRSLSHTSFVTNTDGKETASRMCCRRSAQVSQSVNFTGVRFLREGERLCSHQSSELQQVSRSVEKTAFRQKLV